MSDIQCDEQGNNWNGRPIGQSNNGLSLDKALQEARFALDYARLNNLSAVLRPEALQALIVSAAVQS